MSSELEQMLKLIESMSPQEKEEMALKVVSAINSMAFDIVAKHSIAKSQGRDMLTEQEMVDIVQSGVSQIERPSIQLGH